MTSNYIAHTDLSKLSLLELWRVAKSPLIWLLVVIKLKILGGNTIYSFAIGDQFFAPEQWGELASLKESLQQKLHPFVEEGLQAGNAPALCTEVDIIGPAQLGLAVQRSPSGRFYLAHTVFTNWETGQPVESFSTACVTPLNDGTFLVSRNRQEEINRGPIFRIAIKMGASVQELIDFHEQRLTEWTGSPSRLVQSDLEMVQSQIEEEQREREFLIQRGFSRHLTEDEVAQLRTRFPATTSQESTTDDSERTHSSNDGNEPYVAEVVAPLDQYGVPVEKSSRYGAILNVIEQTAQAKSSWTSSMLLLIGSIVGFVAAGFAEFDLESLAGLILVLFIHEAGHYVAMSYFGYRNLRMFFIPFLGAAVSGRNYNVPGWKKAIVSLAGPVPGILIGSFLIAQPWWQSEWVKSLATWFLALNIFNLLPFLPLDGGWIVHAVISSRNRYLELIARILGPLALIGLGVSSSSFLVIGLGLLMLKAVPVQFKLAGVTTRLREEGIQAEASDDEIPTSTAVRIIDKIEEVVPEQLPAIVGPQVTNVFEALNAKPPGVFASLAILATHIGCMTVLPFAALAIMSLWNQPNLNFTEESPTVSISSDQPVEVHSGEFYEPSSDTTLLMIVKEDEALAELALNDFRDCASDRDSAKRLGTITFLDVADAEEAKTIRTRLQELEHTVSSFRPFGPQITITLGEPTEQNRVVRDQLNSYLSTPPPCQPIPPWHPNLTINAEQTKRRENLNTLSRFVERIEMPAEVSATYETMNSLRRERDESQRDEVIKLQQLADKLRRDHVISTTTNANQHGELSDIPGDFVQGYLNTVSPGPPSAPHEDDEFDAWQVAYDQGLREFGKRLGQLPLEEMQPSYEDQCFCCSGILMEDENGLVQINANFVDPSVALPELVRWLNEHGCEDLTLRVERQLDFSAAFDIFGQPEAELAAEAEEADAEGEK